MEMSDLRSWKNSDSFIFSLFFCFVLFLKRAIVFLRNEKVLFTRRTAPNSTTRGSLKLGPWNLQSWASPWPLNLILSNVRRVQVSMSRTHGYGNTKDTRPKYRRGDKPRMRLPPTSSILRLGGVTSARSMHALMEEEMQLALLQAHRITIRTAIFSMVVTLGSCQGLCFREDWQPPSHRKGSLFQSTKLVQN